MKARMTLFVVAIALLLSAPAIAQPLTDAQCSVLKQLGAKFGALNHGSDDQRREFALKVAQQFAFSFPSEGFGSKSAGAGRPQTKDVVARQKNGVLDGWDLVNGSTLDVVCTSHLTLDGQVFIPVQPVDYLGSAPPPPPPPPPGDFATKADLEALAARVAKLEAGSTQPGNPPPADEQLVILRQILELLKKTAGKFGVQ